MLYGFNALVGAVRFGLEHATLCAAEVAPSTTSGGYGARAVKWACLACSWDGGDRVCTRRGRCAFCERRSSGALWRMLGMVAGRLGAVRACGLVAGKVGALDREWQWTVGCLLDMLFR